MFGFEIVIYLNENGYPEWRHDFEHEEMLNPEQQKTFKQLHDEYKRWQRAMRGSQLATDSLARIQALRAQKGKAS